MSRLSFLVLIVIGLTLTVYFASEAWRLSDSDRLELTTDISHRCYLELRFSRASIPSGGANIESETF